MATVTPPMNSMPVSFEANTVVKYVRSLGAYSAADTWTLKVYLAGAKALGFVTASADVDGISFDVTIPAAFSAPAIPGSYQWREIVQRTTPADGPYLAASGVVLITADITTATDGSMQSFEEQQLAKVEAVLSGRVTTGGDVEHYVIGNRAMTKIPHNELRQYRAWLKEVIAEQRRGGTLREVRAHFPGVQSESGETRVTPLREWQP